MRKHFIPDYTPLYTPFVNEPLWGKRSYDVTFMDEEHWQEWKRDNRCRLLVGMDAGGTPSGKQTWKR